MKKQRIYLSLFFILILFVVSGILAFSQNIDKSGTILFGFFNKPFKLGLDLQGGTHLVYEADLSDIREEDYNSALAGLRDIIERRINMFGISEPIVQTQKAASHYRLIVELAGVKDVNEAIKMIGETPFLEFREQRSEEEKNLIIEKRKEIEGKSEEEIKQIENWQLALKDPNFKPTVLTGKYLIASKTDLAFDQNNQQPIILLQFNDEGSKIFEELTKRNVGKILAIYIDGVPISTPVVQSVISGGKAQISGNFTIEEARGLVRNLKAGALPVPIKLISEQTVGPILGKISLEKSLKAGIFGFLAIIIFLIIYYRLPGFLASFSLLIYVVLILALFKLIPVTLTLAGIGGFILSMGMAVDANILIFSRMREELKEEKNFSTSLIEGFRRSWPSIRDGNLTTLIVALILFWFGTSFVKGFALTLSIGILISVFSAMFVTRIFLAFFALINTEKIRWLLG